MLSSSEYETHQINVFWNSSVKYIHLYTYPITLLSHKKEKSIIALQEKQHTTTL